MEKLNLNPSSQIEPAPEPTAFDRALTVGKLGGLVLPFVGAGATFIELLTGPLRGRRLNDWYEEVRLGVNDLSQKVEGLTWEKLVSDEGFFSALAQATQAAIKTHQQGKRDALRNAVLNVAAGRSPSDDLQLIFLNLVDSFTPTHLLALALLNSKDGSEFAKFREGQPEMTDLAVRDLRDRGLCKDMRSNASQDRDLPPPSLLLNYFVVPDLGKKFLAFINAPEPAG